MANYYVLEYETGEDFVNRRAPYRTEHLAVVREAHARGEVVMGGALGDPPQGALIIFRADSQEVAEAFARADPYVVSGVITRWTVRRWHVVIGQQD
jgi:uncharacterized protein YciI